MAAVAEAVITAETSDDEINKLVNAWSYSSGVPGWVLRRLLHAERRIQALEANRGKS